MSPHQKRQLVQRVIRSPIFERSAAMCSFLLYITEHAISEKPEKLKEQAIGAEVLGRKPNYDPADDNIVRVRAHELRDRLEKYFASIGSDEPVVIRVPRGSYVPEFVPRKIATSAKSSGSQTPEPADTSSLKSPQPLLRRHWLSLAAAFVLAISAAVALTLYAVRGETRSSAASPNAATRDFWSQFFNKPNKDLKIVYADTSFGLWQDMNGKSLDLGDYLSHRYLDVPNDKLGEIASRRATSPADLAVSTRLAVLAAEFGGQVNLQFARSASTEFVHQGNIVLIGSHRSNPWIEVVEPNLNFQLSQDPHSGAPVFLNRSPQPQEAPRYAIPAALDTQGDEKREFISYGVLALLKGCGERGFMVVDEGLNMQATEAVGDLITDPQRLDNFLRSIGHVSGSNVAPFEALIQITSLPGGYDSPRVVAFRLRPASSCAGN